MSTAAHDLQTHLEAIRRRIQLSREAVAVGQDVDLSLLGGEVQEVSEALRKAPLQFDREGMVRNLEAIIIDLNGLQRELSARQGTMGGETVTDDGTDD